MSDDLAIPFDDIVWACTHLCELLEYENDALAHHETEVVRELADNKAALARIYGQAVATMADAPESADALLAPEQREELMSWGVRLKSLVEENASRLKAEMEAYDRVMDAVASAVRSATLGTTNYTPAGDFEGTSNGERNSLTFNRTL